MDKLNETVAVHLTARQHRQLLLLSEMEGAPISKYVREIIDSHLGNKQAQFDRMREAFDYQDSDSSLSSQDSCGQKKPASA